MSRSYAFETALGWCRVEWQADRIGAFFLPEALDTPAPSVETESAIAPPAWIDALADRVRRHLAGSAQDFSDVPLVWERVTDFQRAVYHAALAVKSGQTSTYGQLAAAMGRPPAEARAVGVALGRNPWPLLVPCHRIVGAGGKLTGFSAPGGVATKRRLLAIEGAELMLL